MRFIEAYPHLYDRKPAARFDAHYFHQDLRAERKIVRSGVRSHVDIGPSIELVRFLTVVCKVTFIDMRLLMARLENLIHGIGLPDRILEYFKGLDLVESSGMDDGAVFRENTDIPIPGQTH